MRPRTARAVGIVHVHAAARWLGEEVLQLELGKHRERRALHRLAARGEQSVRLQPMDEAHGQLARADELHAVENGAGPVGVFGARGE